MVTSIESLMLIGLWCLVAMVVTIESKVTINGKFYATGPRRYYLETDPDPIAMVIRVEL